MSTMTASASSGPVDPVGADLVRTVTELKLGQMAQTLPERLVLARQQKMSHAAFLQLVLADEITRRDSRSAVLRARAAGLDPAMRLDTWDELDDLTCDRELLAEPGHAAVHEADHAALVLGPVGVGKTHLASALGHIAIRRRMTVHVRAPTSCSPGCAPPGWTTPWKPSSASWPASSCSSSTTSRSNHST